MYPVQFHPSPVKDGRRILGEKPANACLSPARNRNVDAASSPVKRPLSGYSSSASPSKKLLPSPSIGGQKRTIDQVEDPPIPFGGMLVCGEEYNRMQAAAERAMRKEMSRAKQQERQQQQQQQHQHQHQHQQSPIETRQDLPSPLNVSSNQSHGHNTTRSVPEDPETRKVFIQEKANLLRNRIQSAMRHVKDDQLDRRLSDLEAHSRKYPRLSNQPPQQDNQTPKPAAALQSIRTHSTATSPLSEATPRTLQPAPDMNETTSNNADKSASGLSSPPLSANNTTHDPMRTPTQTTLHHHHHSGTSQSPMQLSSPPATVMRSGCDTDIAGTEQHAGGIPSQKGDAVDGLLKLMNTADKRENLDA